MNEIAISRNREELRVKSQIRRALNAGLPATLTLEEWLTNISFFGGLCAYCKIKPFEVLEHIVPISAGSSGTTAENCVPACEECNQKKRTTPLSPDKSTKLVDTVVIFTEENIYDPLRIWKTTHHMLRLLAAQSDESLVELLDRMAREEMQRRKEDMHAQGIQVSDLSEQND